MKKSLIAIASIALGLLAFASCSENAETLTSSMIVKKSNKVLYYAGTDSLAATVATGYYECNSYDQRVVLRKLEAAGLVTYNVERFAWWKAVTRSRQVETGWSYWWGSTYTTTYYKDYKFQEHFMVNVQLTKAGEKLLLSQGIYPKPEIDKDLLMPFYDPSQYPENQKTYEENWPEIPRPDAKPKTEKQEQPARTNPARTNSTPKAETKEPEDTRCQAEKDYDAAKQREYSQDVIMYAGRVKAVKARNIVLSESNGAAAASAEVIYKTFKVSAAGRILNYLIEGNKSTNSVSLKYYEDKGWVIER